ncbi:MAG: glycerate kinase, partial [Akkermansiaceae bacterium]
MHILIAPDKFKGTLSAPEVCQIVANAFSSRIVSSKITTCPIADGGDGFMDILRHHSQGNLVPCSATDALGRPITAHYALCGNTAVIEMATASGLAHISPHQLDIWESSTIGTGEMIRHATEAHHVDRILIGIGGSATNDAGCGMAHALGAQFLDSHQQPISPTPRGLRTCSSINLENVIPLPKITVACDVDNPLLGERGATMTYASQKGASPADLLELENTLHHIAHLTNT